MGNTSEFQIILSFKAVMDGLNSYVNAYKARMAEVQAFNQKIMSGGGAIQQAVGQLGLLLGGAALVKYAHDAAEADKVQQQFLRTLARTGNTGAVEALNAQSSALQRLTLYSDEAVTTVQRLLISAGLSAKQTQDLTEHVLDFAQETGQAAESAAALIARTLRGQTDELGRYNIKLDNSKGKVDALREALIKYASGAARGAVADASSRDSAARFADATEDLGRAVNRLITPLKAQLIPLLEGVVKLAGQLATALAPVMPVLGELARGFLVAIAAVAAFKLSATAVMFVLNPLRAAFVLLAGAPLLQFSNTLAAATAGAGFFQTSAFLMKNSLTSLVGAGQAAAIGLSLVGAAFAGWELGKMINEIQVSGLAITDWVAIAMVWIGDKFDGVLSGLRRAWVVTRTGGEAFWDALKLATIGGVLFILEAWNKLPFKNIPKADLAPLRKEFDETAAHILGTSDRLNNELNGIDRDRAKKILENAELAAYIETQGRAAAAGKSTSGPGAGGKGPAAGGAGGNDLNAENFGLDQAQMFELQTKLLQAQLAGNQAEVDRITDLLEEKKLKQELAQLEEGASSLIKGRLDVEVSSRDKVRRTTAEEILFQQRLGDLEIRRANIEADRQLSDLEKQAQINSLLAIENRLLDEKIAKDEKLLRAGVTDEEKTRLLQEITTLRKQLAENAGDAQPAQTLQQRDANAVKDLNDPSKHYQSTDAGAAGGAKGFLAEVGTAGDNAAESITSTLNGALQSTSDLLFNLGTGAMTFQQAWSGAILSIGRNFARMAADMVAKMIWRNTVERALTALGVGTHVAGEGAKTAATAAGTGVRLVLVIKEALAAVYHGAVAAFSALAGIPIVGPILGAAALAGALALGIGLVGKIGHADGAIIRGPGGPRDDRIPAMLSNGEAVTRASSVSKFGEGFFNALNAGVLDLSALPDSVARQLPAAAAPRSGGGSAGGQGSPAPAGGNIHLAFHNTEADAVESLKKSRDGRRFLVDLIERTVRDMT